MTEEGGEVGWEENGGDGGGGEDNGGAGQEVKAGARAGTQLRGRHGKAALGGRDSGSRGWNEASHLHTFCASRNLPTQQNAASSRTMAVQGFHSRGREHGPRGPGPG
jgi:hypothetical protein